MWIVGDNFTAKSYRAHFKLVTGRTFYIKENFEFSAFCNSRFNSANLNMLSRLQNTLAMAMNRTKTGLLPKYILVILDDDLITYLDFKQEGVATLLGSWIEWLVREFNKVIKARKEQVPMKCKKADTCFYWVAAPTHSNFSKDRNHLRVKYNLSLESVIRGQPNMRVIPLKNDWNSQDGKLVINDKITEMGMTAYWRAIDESFKYNAVKHETFLARQLSSNTMKTTERTEEVFDSNRADPMHQFFNRRRDRDFGNVENRMGFREEMSLSRRVHPYHGDRRRNFNRFRLPCLGHKHF